MAKKGNYSFLEISGCYFQRHTIYGGPSWSKLYELFLLKHTYKTVCLINFLWCFINKYIYPLNYFYIFAFSSISWIIFSCARISWQILHTIAPLPRMLLSFTTCTYSAQFLICGIIICISRTSQLWLVDRFCFGNTRVSLDILTAVNQTVGCVSQNPKMQ